MSVHWISPFDPAKNIGGAINKAIEQLNAADDDFIILTDQDVLFLQPDTKAHILDILETTTYDVLGSMTNRLGLPAQCIKGMFGEDSIAAHIDLAKRAWDAWEDNIWGTDIIAGMLMCFRVSTWRRVGGFNEHRLNFDWLFCDRVCKCGLRIGIMKGVYVLHLYRYGSANPQNDFKHLEI